jgi:membrane-bound inhibitor of C-type lysozyme
MRVKKNGVILVSVLCAALLLQVPFVGAQEALSIKGGDPLVYLCDNGDRLVARYYVLSDESLRFVKVLFPDGREYTLPQVVSASGARYTDDIELLWWVKGDDAYVEMRDGEGNWQPVYKECRAQP